MDNHKKQASDVVIHLTLALDKEKVNQMLQASSKVKNRNNSEEDLVHFLQLQKALGSLQ